MPQFRIQVSGSVVKTEILALTDSVQVTGFGKANKKKNHNYYCSDKDQILEDSHS